MTFANVIKMREDNKLSILVSSVPKKKKKKSELLICCDTRNFIRV